MKHFLIEWIRVISGCFVVAVALLLGFSILVLTASIAGWVTLTLILFLSMTAWVTWEEINK